MKETISKYGLILKGSENTIMNSGLFSNILAAISFFAGYSTIGWILIAIGMTIIGLGLFSYYIQFKQVYTSIKQDVDNVKSFIGPLRNVQQETVRRTTPKSNANSGMKDVTDSVKEEI